MIERERRKVSEREAKRVRVKERSKESDGKKEK